MKVILLLILAPAIALVLLFLVTMDMPKSISTRCKDYKGPDIAIGTVMNLGGCKAAGQSARK